MQEGRCTEATLDRPYAKHLASEQGTAACQQLISIRQGQSESYPG